MVCSLCQTPNTTKTTCPLNIKNPNKNNWDKHYLAKGKIIQNPKPNPKPKYKPNSLLKNRPKHKHKHKSKSNKKVKVCKLFKNTYKDTLIGIKSINSILKARQKKSDSYKFNISGYEFKQLNIGVSNPEIFNLELKISSKFNKEFVIYLNLIHDIYETLSELSCDRIDYFTNPGPRTQTLLGTLSDTNIQFINFLVSNRYYKGGNESNIDFHLPLDLIINKLDEEFTEKELHNLKLVTSIPKLSKKLNTPISI